MFVMHETIVRGGMQSLAPHVWYVIGRRDMTRIKSSQGALDHRDRYYYPPWLVPRGHIRFANNKLHHCLQYPKFSPLP